MFPRIGIHKSQVDGLYWMQGQPLVGSARAKKGTAEEMIKFDMFESC